MGRRHKNKYIINKTRSYNQYFNLLKNIAISSIEWENLPPSVDGRYIETQLFYNGNVVFFNDDVLNENLCLDVIANGNFNVYGEPIRRTAYSKYNQYQYELTDKNSVIIWENLNRSSCCVDIQTFANRLAFLDSITDINVNAQKTPVALIASEKQRLTMINLYKRYDGGEPFIFGDDSLDLTDIKALVTGAPYIADKIYELKCNIWNEALTYLGIPNLNITKKERLITDEVIRYQGGTIACRYSRLSARQQAVDKINAMFGTDIVVDIRDEFKGGGYHE